MSKNLPEDHVSFTVIIPRQLQRELQDARRASGRLQNYIVERGIRLGIASVLEQEARDNPGRIQTSATPSAAPDPKAPANVAKPAHSKPAAAVGTPALPDALAAVRGLKVGPQVWLTLDPILAAYKVKREDLIPECNPQEDIPKFEGEEFIDVVCRRIIESLSTVSYETRETISKHLDKIVESLLV